MKTFLVIIKTEMETFHVLNIKASDMSDAYCQVKIFPTLKEVVQITLMS